MLERNVRTYVMRDTCVTKMIYNVKNVKSCFRAWPLFSVLKRAIYAVQKFYMYVFSTH